MKYKITAEPDRFEEAVEWFAERFPVTEEIREKLGEYAGERAWTIAGVAQLRVVLDVYDSLRDAIADGTPFEEWKREVSDKLSEAWGRADSARIETIFRNATQHAYVAGRWRQMHEPAVLAARPYALFWGIRDARQSEICRECHGTCVPFNHPWWETHTPPLHHNCRSSVRNLTRAEAFRRGITASPPTIEATEGFGEPPTFEGWKPDPDDYPPTLWAEFQKKAAELKARSPKPRPKRKPKRQTR